MEDFQKQMSGDVLIERVNLLRATIVEVSNFKKRLFEYIHLSNKKIIVDLSKCDYIGSLFFGTLVAAVKRTRETGGDIKVVIGSPAVKDEDALTRFLKVFEIYDSVKDARKSFRSKRKEPQFEFANQTRYLCEKYNYK
jgi:anti-anti-sigma factor